jgi:hypothetical protein
MAKFIARIVFVVLALTSSAFGQTVTNVDATTIGDARSELGKLIARRDLLGDSASVTEQQLASVISELDAINTDLIGGTPPASLLPRLQAVYDGIDDLRTDISQDEANASFASQLEALREARDEAGLDILRHFGVGLVLAGDIGGSDRVEGASIVDGRVVVEADRNVRAGAILEYHTWMFCERLDKGDPNFSVSTEDANLYLHRINDRYRATLKDRGDRDDVLKQIPPCDPSRRSSGLFVAVQPGSDELVDALGVGWMWRLPDKLQLFGNRTLNIGFGFMSDPNVAVLADGFAENMNAPQDSDGNFLPVRLRETDKTAFFITASLEIGEK